MAFIKPFRAWRYDRTRTPQLGQLTAPLFDVVSDRQRALLYQNPLNSIHLSAPPAVPNAVAKLAQWKADGTLALDPLPGIYVYYQHFSLPGQPQPLVRKGFIAHLRVGSADAGTVLRHENTLPGAVGNRLELLAATQLNASPTHGLYTDDTFALEPLLDDSMRCPIYDLEDYQGVRDVLSVLHDARAIGQVVSHLREQTIILADGHHRYQGALAYQRQRAADNPRHTGQEPYNFHLMYLTNAAAPDLCILPTHRLLANLPNFDPDTLLARLETYFTVQPVADACDLPEVIAGKRWTFGLALRDRACVLRLRPDIQPNRDVPWPFPAVVKELDLTVLHYFALEQTLGVAGKDQTRDPHLRHERNFAECLAQVASGAAQVAFVVNAVTMADVQRVCESGAVMPPKSTYFYPKVLSGLVFSSLVDDEFNAPTRSGL